MKDKKIIALIAFVVILLALLTYLKSSQKKPTNWKPTFENTDTNPYGTYINYQLLKDIFNQNNVRSTRKPIYNNLKTILQDYYDYEDESDADYYSREEDSVKYITPDTIKYDPASIYDVDLKDTTAYIFVNKSFSLDKVDLEYLLDFVGIGNNVFISAEDIASTLMDTLGIKQRRYFFDKDSTYSLVDYPNKKYAFGKIYYNTKLNTDSCDYPVRLLATNQKNDTVFIQVKYGNGNFYLHTVPMAFTNINLLNTDKYDFAFRCLSYLPRNNSVIWDEYQKQGDPGSDSMFRVMLESKPLRIALWIILLGLFLFMIFRAKRIQRIIPIINPPVNSSIEFLNTVSNLYYRKKDFVSIVEKRHAYFLDYIRKNYYLPTENIDAEFIDALKAKSGLEKDKLIELFASYREVFEQSSISNALFLKYNSLLEEFYRNAKK